MELDRYLSDLSGEFEAQKRRQERAWALESAQGEALEITLNARLHASVGREIYLGLVTGEELAVVVKEVGKDWILVKQAGCEILFLVNSITTFRNLTVSPREVGTMEKQMTFMVVLRQWARERKEVLVTYHGGSRRGRIDRVGTDFFDLREAGQTSCAVAFNTLLHIRTRM